MLFKIKFLEDETILKGTERNGKGLKMILNNMTENKDILLFCDVRIAQLNNDRKKALQHCEDDFIHEINIRIDAKIDEINHIKKIINDLQFKDYLEQHLEQHSDEIEL